MAATREEAGILAAARAPDRVEEQARRTRAAAALAIPAAVADLVRAGIPGAAAEVVDTPAAATAAAPAVAIAAVNPHLLMLPVGAIPRSLLTHHFDEHAFGALPVEFRVEDALPGPEIELPGGNGENDLMMDEQRLQV